MRFVLLRSSHTILSCYLYFTFVVSRLYSLCTYFSVILYNVIYMRYFLLNTSHPFRYRVCHLLPSTQLCLPTTQSCGTYHLVTTASRTSTTTSWTAWTAYQNYTSTIHYSTVAVPIYGSTHMPTLPGWRFTVTSSVTHPLVGRVRTMILFILSKSFSFLLYSLSSKPFRISEMKLFLHKEVRYTAMAQTMQKITHTIQEIAHTMQKIAHNMQKIAHIVQI